MDADQIRGLEPLLDEFLSAFDDCFITGGTRGHLPVYVAGQLSDLPRKSVEPMALQAAIPPRTLQEFLSLLKWDENLMRARAQQIVVREHSSPQGIGIIDETGCPKKGNKTPGVQRQHCGATGKVDNCVVSVHLGYAVGDFHCLLASELYLPESWAEDRARCQAAGIPEDMVYRPKWKIALELLDEARANGLNFPWLTFDEGYGGKPPFLRALGERGQRYVGELPSNFMVWVRVPRVTQRSFRRRRRGQGRSTPRLVAGSRPPVAVGNLLRFVSSVRDKGWITYRVKDGTQGPIVWKVKHLLVHVKDERGLPSGPVHLVVACNALNLAEVKYFISNADPTTSVQQLLLVAFSRWHVERCFEDEKTELGFDHFEGRKYIGLKRHQAITAVSHLFLARVHQELRRKKESRTHGMPGPNRGRRSRPVVVEGPHRSRGGKNRVRPVELGRITKKPHEENAPPPPSRRHQAYRNRPMPLGYELTLAL